MNCECVVKHIPLPMVEYQIAIGDDIVALCPTSFFNLKQLVSEYQIDNREPSGAIKKHYSSFIQELAQRMWVDTQPGGVLS